LLGLLFHNEDGGSTFVRNVGGLVPATRRYIPEGNVSSSDIRFVLIGTETLQALWAFGVSFETLTRQSLPVFFSMMCKLFWSFRDSKMEIAKL
jgi:hypothetical protein